MKTSLYQGAAPQRRSTPRVNYRPHRKTPSSGQHPRRRARCAYSRNGGHLLAVRPDGMGDISSFYSHNQFKGFKRSFLDHYCGVLAYMNENSLSVVQ
jgi:hypothetical protein